VLWVANDCLFVDDVTAAVPDAGPCLPAEIALDARHPPNPYLTDTLTVVLRCVAAQRECGGALRLTTGWSQRETAISRRVRFSIPAGHARRLRVPLTCHGYRTLRRTLARNAEAVVRLDARTGDGERFFGELWYEVSSGPAEAFRRCAGIPAGRSRLPDSVDVGPLRGQALARTPCRFDRDVGFGNPGDGTIRLGLDCVPADGVGARAHVDVERVQSGHGIPEDTVRCLTERDRDPSAAPAFSCEFWHGKIRLYTRTWCVGTCDAAWRRRARKAARATLTGLVDRLATLPGRPCRLCPRYFPPERVSQLTRTFTGTGTTRLGTIRVRVDSRISYFGRGLRVTSGRRVLMKAPRHQGEAQLPRGTYRDVKVVASGEWSLSIAPR
jgi:hypothetical protein